MKKIAFIIPILFLMLIVNVLAVDCTFVTGTVYFPSIGEGNTVANADITITCIPASGIPKVLPSFSAQSDGTFAAQFCSSTCPSGSTIKVGAVSGGLAGETTKECLNSVCNFGVVLSNDPDGMPEFSPLTALVALFGACVGFMFLRREKNVKKN
jgi:hypothetical protein